MNHPTEPESNPVVAHEPTDANTWAITRFGIALGLCVLLVHLILWWLFAHYSSREAKFSPLVPEMIKTQAPREPPEPRLQGNPQADLRKMLQDEDTVLNHYGWVDPERGVVRIPIDRAIDVIATRGLPRFTASAPPNAGSTPAARDPGETSAGRAFGETPKKGGKTKKTGK